VTFTFEFQFQNREERNVRVIPTWNQLNYVLCFWAASRGHIFPEKAHNENDIVLPLVPNSFKLNEIYCQVGRYGSMDIAIVYS
jgi:hypothetical protein